jgi:hypothetical protein
MSANLTTIARDLAKLKAQAAVHDAGDIRSNILKGRNIQRPRRSAAYLEQLALEPGLVGQMARGDLRLGLIGNSTAPINPDTELALQMGAFFADPLGFVMWSFDWGADQSTKVVRLPEPWSALYFSEFGPDAWACELLDTIGQKVSANAFDGAKAVDAVRVAVASGHGIGKSAVTAWLALWLMSTRPNARGVVTASTAPQLESKTWAQVATWAKRCATRAWWDISTGRGSMKMVAIAARESWNVYAQTARAENAESFAGLHAADSSAFFLVDESSGVPDAIHDVMQGATTDGEPFLLSFGNPTRNSGWFHGAFHAQRHRWITRQVDSRSVAITNKEQLDQWVTDYGVNSDFVKVRVRGIFPTASSLQFIAGDLVDQAMSREVQPTDGETVVLGVDVARFGDDTSVIYTRTGRDARSWPIVRLSKVNTMELASRVAEKANLLRSAGRHVAINVDGGGVGGGVVDRLRSLGFEVNEIQFGGKALDSKKYANRRAEIWGLMRDWLAGGALPDDQDLAADLTGVEYGFTVSDQILLEKKSEMKRRGLASPDAADALACTFGVPTPMPMGNAREERQAREKARLVRLNGHDPMADLVAATLA